MLRDYWGEWCTGRIEARRFAFLYALALAAMIILLVVLVGGALTMVELFKNDGTGPGAGWFGGPMFFGFLMLMAGWFNIVVKRGRDIGIPGFVTGIGFLLLLVMGGLGILLTILMALIPAGTFASSGAASAD